MELVDSPFHRLLDVLCDFHQSLTCFAHSQTADLQDLLQLRLPPGEACTYLISRTLRDPRAAVLASFSAAVASHAYDVADGIASDSVAHEMLHSHERCPFHLLNFERTLPGPQYCRVEA